MKAPSKPVLVKKPKPKVIRRRLVGLYTLAGGRALPSAHAVYEVDYSDGTVKLERGQTVHTTQTYRPDLFTTIHAAYMLQQAIEDACRKLDTERGRPEV